MSCILINISSLQTGSIMTAQWPHCEQIDDILLKESQYITDVTHEFRVRIKKMMELQEKVSI